MRRFWLSLLAAAAVATAAAPIELAGEGLDESSWGMTSKGIWLVEHYSPYCSHCRAFAPKWKELVEMYSLAAPLHDFNFAQVDCASNGDLCHQHEVKYYPSIFLYEDGKFKEEFVDKRSVDELAQYVERNWRAEPQTDSAKEVSEDPQVESDSPSKSRLRPAKGAEKVRLPGLHIVDTGESEEDRPGSLNEVPTENTLLQETPNAAAPAKFGAISPQEASSRHPSSSSGLPLPSPMLLTQQPEFKRSAGEDESISVWDKSRGIPDGTVKQLTPEDADRLMDSDAGPSFVKFFAPWCGHCQKLAPHWKSLATSLESKVHVYEMDCDVPENKGVCRKARVQAYPTLMFYNRGAAVEYHGKREKTAMHDWALKTIASTTIKPIHSPFQLENAVKEDAVIVLLLFREGSDQEDLALAREAAKSQMGSTPFYASSSHELASLLSFDNASPPTFFVFKSSSVTPDASFALPSKPLTKRMRAEKTRNWLRGAKLPIVSELDGSNYGTLFPEDSYPSAPLVVLGFLSKKGLQGSFDATLAQFQALSKGWNALGQRAASRQVVWAWVDGDRWAPWSRSSYDVKMGAFDGPVLLVSDPYERVYWKNDLAGAPLRLTDSSVYDLIREGIQTGSLPGVSSDGFIARRSKALVRSTAALFSTALAHPFITFFLVLTSWIGLALLLQKVFASTPDAAGSSGITGFKSNDFAKKD
ncbi:uncharacterized protein JCM15063_002631 [Sporobolomyces koalae]|uniref:uncharacterized protein n=1 Tax=Sporobolomyces koalae TaxID=500713 RepID=UPI0031815705